MHKDKNKAQMIKQSRIYIGDQCCSRHYGCISNVHRSNPNKQDNDDDDEFSINSQLLHEYQAIDISAEPIIEIQVKPQVDMLSVMNIKKKKYQKILEECQIELKEEAKKKNIQKLNQEIKMALKKSKKQKLQPKNKWNHSIFNTNSQNDPQEQQKSLVKTDILQISKPQQTKKVALKPVYERIAEYKSLQNKKNKENNQCCQNKKKQVKPQLQKQINENAKKLLQSMRLQKLKKQEERKIIQAKIRALQIKSRRKVQQCAKKQFEGGQDFDLGDSQYSTFQAREQNRKMVKKEKKPKAISQKNQNNLNQSNTYGPKNFLRKSSNSLLKTKKVPQKAKNTPIIIPSDQNQAVQKQQQQQPKGPFFIWNIPIKPQDIETLQSNINKSQYLNIDRFNYKSGKTFREEANQYLADKMQKKMMRHNDEIKKKTFLDQIEVKKQKYLDQFKKQQAISLKEVFWNEDQIFKPNILQNFHFYAQTHSAS